MSRVERARACHRQHEQIELLDDEPERNHRDAGAHPSKKCSLVGGMITIAANHEMPSLIVSDARARSGHIEPRRVWVRSVERRGLPTGDADWNLAHVNASVMPRERA